MLAVFKGYRVLSTIITTLSIIATAGAGCAFAQAKSSATMAMSWAFEGSHIGYLMAMEKGLYKEEGLNVQVNRGFGAADTIRRMITGDIDFGVIDATLMIRAVSEDPKNEMVMVAATFQTSPYNVIYVKNRKIKGVADLATATFGNTGGSVATLYPTFLKYALKGIPTNKATVVQLDPAVRIGALLRGDVDVVASVLFEWPHIQKAAKEANVELGTINYADHGFDPYTYGIVVKSELLNSQPDLVKRVVHASLNGWAAACNDRKAATTILAKYEPDVPPGGLGEEIQIALQRIVPRGADADKGLGTMSDARWKQTEDMTIEAFNIANPVAVDRVYDRSFLPKAPITANCD
jgi:NitT/TauT family transport system substrate-binding protein